MKKLLHIMVLWLFLFITSVVFADSLTLTKIGALDVNGKYFNHWWYEPTNLTLEGAGSKGANIDVYIDGSVKTVKASVEDGSWKYVHDQQLEKKDHTVKIASGNQQIAFILTIGAGSVPAEEQESVNTLPETGILLPLIGVTLIGALLVFNGFREKSENEIT